MAGAATKHSIDPDRVARWACEDNQTIRDEAQKAVLSAPNKKEQLGLFVAIAQANPTFAEAILPQLPAEKQVSLLAGSIKSPNDKVATFALKQAKKVILTSEEIGLSLETGVKQLVGVAAGKLNGGNFTEVVRTLKAPVALSTAKRVFSELPADQQTTILGSLYCDSSKNVANDLLTVLRRDIAVPILANVAGSMGDELRGRRGEIQSLNARVAELAAENRHLNDRVEANDRAFESGAAYMKSDFQIEEEERQMMRDMTH